MLIFADRRLENKCKGLDWLNTTTHGCFLKDKWDEKRQLLFFLYGEGLSQSTNIDWLNMLLVCCQLLRQTCHNSNFYTPRTLHNSELTWAQIIEHIIGYKTKWLLQIIIIVLNILLIFKLLVISMVEEFERLGIKAIWTKKYASVKFSSALLSGPGNVQRVSRGQIVEFKEI